MFVISMKTSKKRLAIWSGVLICVLFFYAVCFGVNDYDSVYVLSGSNFSVKATDNNSRLEFLSRFGWQANDEPLEISEICIPQEFNDTYEKYNQMQKQQGFNLEKHKGHMCKKFTYKIKNYKNNPSGVNANLIVYKDKIIGGDISSVELSGFMHGFKSPDEVLSTNGSVDWEPRPNIFKSERVNGTTYKEILEPDPKMGTMPID